MAEQWWRRLHGNTQEEAFKNIIKNISEKFYRIVLELVY
jgi:hypothetical protein